MFQKKKDLLELFKESESTIVWALIFDAFLSRDSVSHWEGKKRGLTGIMNVNIQVPSRLRKRGRMLDLN